MALDPNLLHRRSSSEEGSRFDQRKFGSQFLETQSQIASLIEKLEITNTSIPKDDILAIQNTSSALMEKFKDNLYDIENEFNDILTSFKEGNLRLEDFEKIIEAERQKGIFSLELAERMREYLETISNNLVKLIRHLQEDQKHPMTQDAKEVVVKIYQDLSSTMDSAIGMSRLALLAPKDILQAIEALNIQMSERNLHPRLLSFLSLVEEIQNDIAIQTDSKSENGSITSGRESKGVSQLEKSSSSFSFEESPRSLSQKYDYRNLPKNSTTEGILKRSEFVSKNLNKKFVVESNYLQHAPHYPIRVSNTSNSPSKAKFTSFFKTLNDKINSLSTKRVVTFSVASSMSPTPILLMPSSSLSSSSRTNSPGSVGDSKAHALRPVLENQKLTRTNSTASNASTITSVSLSLQSSVKERLGLTSATKASQARKRRGSVTSNAGSDSGREGSENGSVSSAVTDNGRRSSINQGIIGGKASRKPRRRRGSGTGAGKGTSKLTSRGTAKTGRPPTTGINTSAIRALLERESSSEVKGSSLVAYRGREMGLVEENDGRHDMTRKCLKDIVGTVLSFLPYYPDFSRSTAGISKAAEILRISETPSINPVSTGFAHLEMRQKHYSEIRNRFISSRKLVDDAPVTAISPVAVPGARSEGFGMDRSVFVTSKKSLAIDSSFGSGVGADHSKSTSSSNLGVVNSYSSDKEMPWLASSNSPAARLNKTATESTFVSQDVPRESPPKPVVSKLPALPTSSKERDSGAPKDRPHTTAGNSQTRKGAKHYQTPTASSSITHGSRHGAGVVGHHSPSHELSDDDHYKSDQHSNPGSNQASARQNIRRKQSTVNSVLMSHANEFITIYPINTCNRGTDTSDLPGDQSTTNESSGKYVQNITLQAQPRQSISQAMIMSELDKQLSSSKNPLLTIYDLCKHTISESGRARLLAVAVNDAGGSGSGAMDIVTRIFRSVREEMETLMNRTLTVDSDLHKVEDICKYLVVLIETPPDEHDEELKGSLDKFFQDVGQCQLGILWLELLLSEYRTVFEAVSAVDGSLPSKLIRSCDDYSSSYNYFLDCQGAVNSIKNRLAELKQYCSSGFHDRRLISDNSSVASRRTSIGAINEMTNLRQQLEYYMDQNNTLQAEIGHLEQELEDLELELFDTQQSSDRTPSALLFFASLQESNFISSLQQLILQANQLTSLIGNKGGVSEFEEDKEWDFEMISKRVQVCNNCLPDIQSFLERYSNMYKEWAEIRMEEFRDSGPSVDTSDNHDIRSLMVCPTCHLDIRSATTPMILRQRRGRREDEVEDNMSLLSSLTPQRRRSSTASRRSSTSTSTVLLKLSSGGLGPTELPPPASNSSVVFTLGSDQMEDKWGSKDTKRLQHVRTNRYASPNSTATSSSQQSAFSPKHSLGGQSSMKRIQLPELVKQRSRSVLF